MKGVLCLHLRNYKIILVDETDWIYVEFLNLSNTKKVQHFEDQHLLKLIQFECSETSLLVDLKASSARDKMDIELVIAHELAHQWFGNLGKTIFDYIKRKFI